MMTNNNGKTFGDDERLPSVSEWLMSAAGAYVWTGSYGRMICEPCYENGFGFDFSCDRPDSVVRVLVKAVQANNCCYLGGIVVQDLTTPREFYEAIEGQLHMDASRAVKEVFESSSSGLSIRPAYLSWKETAKGLWALMDDIDTSYDLCKPEMRPFDDRLIGILNKRHHLLVSDGYDLSKPSGESDGTLKMNKTAISGAETQTPESLVRSRGERDFDRIIEIAAGIAYRAERGQLPERDWLIELQEIAHWHQGNQENEI